MIINKYRCVCGNSTFFVKDVPPHTGLYCDRCGKFFKWLNKDDKQFVKHLSGGKFYEEK